MSDDDKLWCIWVIGPDTLFAQPDEKTAVKRAVEWNQRLEALRFREKSPLSKLEECVILPVPWVWTGGALGHASSLAEHGGEPDSIC